MQEPPRPRGGCDMIGARGSEPGSVNRLYRNKQRALFFGVCAGIADYFGFDLKVTRALTVVGAMISFPIVFVAYVLLAFLLPVAPYEGAGEVDPVRRQARRDPHELLSNARYRFRDVDARLQRLEKYVTSNRYALEREFSKLKD
jgi:phage shock protein C